MAGDRAGDQFFVNPSGLLADEARAGFERIGLPAAAALVHEARAVHGARPRESDPTDPSFDEADEADRFDEYLSRYDPLLDAFFALVDGELYPRAASYVRAHAAEFVR